MTEHDYNLANASGPSFRTDLNNALLAIISNNSKASAPTTTFPFMWWVDTGASPVTLKMRNQADSAWITIGDITVNNFGLLSLSSAGTITTQHTFNPTGAPFIIGANATLQQVAGLKAEEAGWAKIKVTSDDTTGGYLSGKLVAGDNITLTATGGGVDETLTVKVKDNRADKVTALSDTASIATDASLGNIFTVTITAGRTLAVPTNPTSGQKCIWRIKSSGGAYKLTLTTGSAGAFRFGADITDTTATTDGKTDYIGAIYNATDDRWDVVGYAKGY